MAGVAAVPGSIILLNGCSSAGKTTLAQAIQEASPQPVQYMALDHFRDGMPGKYRGMNSSPDEPGARGLNIIPRDGRTELRFGDVGLAVLRGMRRAIAAFAAAGVDVVVDDLLLERDFLLDYLEAFAGLDVVFVSVRCDLATVNLRESSRPGRFPGTAAAHFHRVHEGCVYDVEVDTADCTPREGACDVIAVAQALPRPTAFDRLRMRLGSGTDAPVTSRDA